MRAVGIYVLIKQTKGETRQRKSGLQVPTQLSDRFVGGVIHSVSQEIGKDEFGLKEGQKILFDKHAGHDIKGTDGETYKVITCRDVAVVL